MHHIGFQKDLFRNYLPLLTLPNYMQFLLALEPYTTKDVYTLFVTTIYVITCFVLFPKEVAFALAAASECCLLLVW